jgi:MerR family transcriptional regulator, light-induced transcriptional regulator
MAFEPQPGLNIAALARKTGVPAHTLRKWEQRYGVLAPARTTGGQRRYTEVDVARVTWLRDRLKDGYQIGAAAALLAATEAPPATSTRDLRAALLAAVERVDVDGTERILDQAFALHPFETVADELLAPVLTEVGTRWETGALSVAQEHMLSAAIRGRIIRLLADRRPAVRGRVVLACAPGERHELGLLVLGALLAADGWSVVYLGAETPVVDALAIATQVDADVACFSVTLAQHVEVLAKELPQARARRPEIVVGGPPVDRRLAALLGARYAGPSASGAVRALARLAA